MKANLYNTVGCVYSDANFSLVKKSLLINEEIPRHNHPDHTIVFTVVKGSVKLLINDVEEYTLSPGVVLKFEGENMLSAKANEESEMFITLIRKVKDE